MYLQVCWAAKGKMRGRAFHSYWKNECLSRHLLYSPVLPFPFLETDFGSLSYGFPTVSVLSGRQNTAKLPPLEFWAKVKVPAIARRELFPGELETSSVLTGVLLFNAKGAELKSAIISEMDKQNGPFVAGVTWSHWGKTGSLLSSNSGDVSVKGRCTAEGHLWSQLEQAHSRIFTGSTLYKTFQVTHEWGLAQRGTYFLAGGEENNLCPGSHQPVTQVWEETLQLRCPELQGIITKRGSCLLHSIKYVPPPGLFLNRPIKPWVKELHQVLWYGYLGWRNLPIIAAHISDTVILTQLVSLWMAVDCLHRFQSASCSRVAREQCLQATFQE